MNQINDILRVKDIFFAAIGAVDPFKAVSNHTNYIRSLYKKERHERLIVTAFGKAAYPMAQAACSDLNDIITNCMVITKYGHALDNQTHTSHEHINKIRIYEANHPVPDMNGLMAAQELIKCIHFRDTKTLIVCLISGGGSALLVCPCQGITLDDKQQTTEILLRSGADIHEINTIRKHISQVKGGRLAELVYPGSLITLIISDVIGDNLDVIASGPTAPDSTTFSDACSIIENYNLLNTLPVSVINHIEQGRKGTIPDTPKAGSKIFSKVENHLIATNSQALKAARQEAENQGLVPTLNSSEVTGEARRAGMQLAQKALKIKGRQSCLISGGETTVTVKGSGKGGRNMELALAFALKIEGCPGITFLSAGTDGTDGPTDATGAIVNGETVVKARQMGLKPEAFLDNNDSYCFFQKVGGLFITGPTQTNVMDIQIVITSPDFL